MTVIFGVITILGTVFGYEALHPNEELILKAALHVDPAEIELPSKAKSSVKLEWSVVSNKPFVLDDVAIHISAERLSDRGSSELSPEDLKSMLGVSQQEIRLSLPGTNHPTGELEVPLTFDQTGRFTLIFKLMAPSAKLGVEKKVSLNVLPQVVAVAHNSVEFPDSVYFEEPFAVILEKEGISVEDDDAVEKGGIWLEPFGARAEAGIDVFSAKSIDEKDQTLTDGEIRTGFSYPPVIELRKNFGVFYVGKLEQDMPLTVPIGRSLYTLKLLDERKLTFEKVNMTRCPVIVRVNTENWEYNVWKDFVDPKYGVPFSVQNGHGAGANWWTALKIGAHEFSTTEDMSAVFGDVVETEFPVFYRIKGRSGRKGFVVFDTGGSNLIMRDCTEKRSIFDE